MNRIVIAIILILLVLYLLPRRLARRRQPHCHYIYGCGYNAPDWAYWDFKTPWKM
jgi:hypothetical protein